ncbi:MAG TPA: hypothetical protein VI565_12060, partial [Burkholderiales bacterium]|nr:hypothetical protein [Burkholderiales bacterium]
MGTSARRIAAVVAMALFTGCAAPEPSPPRDGSIAPNPFAEIGGPEFSIASASFENGAPIPREFTCDGGATSPALQISGAPSAARTAALIVGDPDAPFPQAPQRNFTHWIAWNVPIAADRTA